MKPLPLSSRTPILEEEGSAFQQHVGKADSCADVWRFGMTVCRRKQSGGPPLSGFGPCLALRTETSRLQSVEGSKREWAAPPVRVVLESRADVCLKRNQADTEKVRIHGINEAYAAEERR